MPARNVVNLIGFTVADDPANARTTVTSISASGGASGVIAIPITNAVGSTDSVTVAPAGSVLTFAKASGGGYDALSTIDIGTPASPGSILDATWVDITQAVVFKSGEFPPGTTLGANAIRVRRVGASIGGACTVYVGWTVPQT